MEHERRDRVMRAYFEGRDWDDNPEFKLKRKLVLAGDPQLADFPFLLDDEWEVSAGATNLGKGDLLFGDGAGRYAVVEVKWMNDLGGGRTARTARNKKRKAVRQQAWTYAQAVRRLHPDAVEVRALVLTDDWIGNGSEVFRLVATNGPTEAEAGAGVEVDEESEQG